MPNNAKKKLSKIKGVEKAHPHSRKAVQMRRALAREEKIVKLRTEKNATQRAAVDRMVFFKFALPDDVKMATLEMAHDIIEQYIARNDDEIKEMTESLRPGKPKPPKLIQLQSLREKDVQEYNAGFTLPNMLDAANVKRMRAWNGDYNGLGEIKMTKLRSPAAVEKEKEDKSFVEKAGAERAERELMAKLYDPIPEDDNDAKQDGEEDMADDDEHGHDSDAMED
ncbi:hypothetical protein HDU96_007940 [Phlyctochytrium bullatum]|nr:hypothetical protein HDU96_007940 [Phlyctochytrium bullatum]